MLLELKPQNIEVFLVWRILILLLLIIIIIITIIIIIIRAIGLMSRVFANGPEDRGSVLGRVIPKTQKMVLDTALLNTQHYKVGIKGKWSNPGKE